MDKGLWVFDEELCCDFVDEGLFLWVRGVLDKLLQELLYGDLLQEDETGQVLELVCDRV